jgi:hypothetical protein
MSFLMKIFLYTFLLNVFIYADSDSNTNCSSVETISELDNITSLTTHTEEGSVTYNEDRNDYYKYTVKADGIISISHTSDRYNELWIGTTCSNYAVGNTFYIGSQNWSHSTSFSVSKNTTIYTRIRRPDYQGTAYYNHEVTFTPSTPSISIDDFEQQEGDSGTTTFSIPVTLSPTSTSTETINYSTSNSSAIAGSDYVSKSGTITFAPGESSKNIDITVYGDTTYEGNEDFYITLSKVSGSATITDNQATITIGNDDAPTYVTLEDDVSINEGNYGTYTKKITVTASNLNGNTIKVDYSTNDGTATTANSDYTATSGTLTFTEDSLTHTVSITINGDTTIESDETFTLNLSNPIGALINNSSTTITLINDDGGSVDTNLRDFLIRNPVSSRNITGNLAFIGNTVLCVDENQDGTCDNYTGTQTNTSLNLKFIDVDGVNRTFNNSSQALLSIPNTATVKWAGVYTQGYLDNVTNSTTANNLISDSIYLTIPSIGTFSSTPLVMNKYANGNDGYTYATFSEVKELQNKIGANINGWITAANIKAYEGADNSGLGNFGAWTLVVIYEDDSESLKNISVFDGYRRIANETAFQTVDIPITGFLTPTSGDISSTLSIFAAEGDKNIEGDKLYASNSSGTFIAINETNAFYSSISGVTRNPSITNNQGIDIQNHELGNTTTTGLNIIGNSQQSSTIRLTSTQDTYFPSVVAFTTELYEPRVCYYQELLDENGYEITSASIGDTITVSTWISNMKKDAADSNLETADKVEITVELDSENLDYAAGTTFMQNIGESTYESKTDAQSDDTVDYFDESNSTKWRVGTGANATDGGTLEPNVSGSDDLKTFVQFQTTLLQSGDINISNVYKVSYENSLLGVRFGDESPLNIGICKDFSTALSVSAPLGIFNVVNENFTGSTDPEDVKDSLNALYTQVSNHSFDVKILALDSDNTTLDTYTGDINITIIDTPSYVENDDDENTVRCKNAILSSSYALRTVNFSNSSSEEETFTYTEANENLSFGIIYEDTDGTSSYVCSRDSFSVRPAGYVITSNTTPMVGGKDYTLTIDSEATGYNQTFTASANVAAKLDLIVPSGCTLASYSEDLTLPFSFTTGGVATYSSFGYDNVGDVNLTIEDKDWTAIDQDLSNSKGYDDCIVDSDSNTPVNAKVGCDIKTIEQFFFTPKDFSNTLSIEDNNSSSFTYISNDLAMSALMNITATARLDNDATATNYTAGCYAKDINTTVTLLNDVPNAQWLDNDNTAKNRILFFSGADGTTTSESNATATSTLSSDESNFASGVANLQINFNFSRSTTTPDEPFQIQKNDFNITITDNNTTGSDFDRTTDMNTTFYYGRVHAPDYTFKGDSGTTTIYYETYCKSCDKTDLNITGNESVDSINWYQNVLHTDISQGMVNPFTPNGAVSINTSTSSISQGRETQAVSVSSSLLPYIDKINMTSNSWLEHYPTSFDVQFLGSGSWAGEGSVKENNTSTGEYIHKSSPNRVNKRLDW